MNSQDILKFFGSRLDVKLDTSEFYDFELITERIDYLDFDYTGETTYTGLTIDTSLTGYTCSGVTYEVTTRRPEKGWTLEFVFNRNNYPWISGGTFYYLGVVGDDDPEDYADNNLSFGFTEDGRIKWSAIHYSGYCDTDSGYTETYYTASGQTGPLCTTGLTKDFHVTIVFDRYSMYTGCDLENEGGQNDLITGATLINDPLDILTGATPEYEYYEVLNKNWFEERSKRLGTLKIYLNGYRIYKLENWEEIIPSTRGEIPLQQLFGMGTPLMGGIHDGVCCFTIKLVKYYIQPLNFLNIKNNFNHLLPNYDFFICGEECSDDLISLSTSKVFQIDLGLSDNTPSRITPSPWNNLCADYGSDIPSGTTTSYMTDTTSRISTITATLMTNNWVAEDNGVSPSALDQIYPVTATRDCLKVGNQEDGIIRIYGCNIEKTYQINILSARQNIGYNTDFTVQGQTNTINPKDNVNTLLTWTGITPTNGSIIITARQALAGSFAYINVIEIFESLSQNCGEETTGELISENDEIIMTQDDNIIIY